MLTPSTLSLLILLYGSVVFTTDSDQNVSSSTCWPKLNRDPPWDNLRGGLSYVFGDDCPHNSFLVPSFPEDLDMKKFMGRWFVGMVAHRYPFHNPNTRKCIIYEFGRLVIRNHQQAQNTTSFNVTQTYQATTHKIGHNKTWKKPEKNIGFMRSCGPINSKLMYKTSIDWRDLDKKFFVYKLGPEGKDSFGRLQYEYAVISYCQNYPALVIARNPEMFNETYKKEVTKWLEDNGILKYWTWIQPDYSGCYFDSITSAFGATEKEFDESPLTIRPHVDSKPVNNSCDPNLANINLAEQVDPWKMMGRWFEGLSTLPSENRTCIIHEYQALEFSLSNFSIDANDTIKFEIVKTYRDEGFPIDMRKEHPIKVVTTELEIHKFSDFWIYKVGPESKDSFGRIQYEYIILSNCNKSWVLVLTRNPEAFKNMHKKNVLLWLQDNDFNIGIEIAEYHPNSSSCHYADSIAEITVH